MPLVRPVTVPVGFTVAIEALEVVQVPPVVVLPSVIEDPVHTADGPVIIPADGVGNTDTICVSRAEPHELVCM